jgi:hypothetical protein
MIVRSIAVLFLVVCLAWLSQACSVQTSACASVDSDQCLQPVETEQHCVVTQPDASCQLGAFQSYKIACDAPIVNPVGVGCRPAAGVDGIMREVEGAAPAWCCQ